MSFLAKCFLLLALVAAAFAAETPTVISNFRQEPPISPDILTNEGVVALADAGFSDAFIVNKILISSRTRFDTSAEGLTYLRRNAIPEDLVGFIVQHVAQPLFAPPPPPQVPAKTKRFMGLFKKGKKDAMVVAVQPTPVPATGSAQVPYRTGRSVASPSVYTPGLGYVPAGYPYAPAGYGYVAGYGYAPIIAGSYSYATPMGLVAVPAAAAKKHWWQ